MFNSQTLAQDQIEESLIHLNKLLSKAWTFQSDLSGLQNEIDLAIADVQDGFYTVLKDSTEKTLNQHDGHHEKVEVTHAPVYERFSALAPGRCRDTTQTMINLERDVTGFEASNCINTYSRATSTLIEELSVDFSNLNVQFSQIQQIVVKAFVQQNIYITPLEASDDMKKMTELVMQRWEEIVPSLKNIRNELRTKIDGFNTELTSCQDVVLDHVIAGYVRIERQLVVCENFNNARRTAFSSNSINDAKQQDAIIEEFKNFLSSMTPYEWQSL